MVCVEFGTVCKLCKMGVKHGQQAAKPRKGDIWKNHYSLSIGAPTDADAVEWAEKCKREKVSCNFDEHLRLKVNSLKHQQQLADAIFGKGKVRNLTRYN